MEKPLISQAKSQQLSYLISYYTLNANLWHWHEAIIPSILQQRAVAYYWGILWTWWYYLSGWLCRSCLPICHLYVRVPVQRCHTPVKKAIGERNYSQTLNNQINLVTLLSEEEAINKSQEAMHYFLEHNLKWFAVKIEILFLFMFWVASFYGLLNSTLCE